MGTKVEAPAQSFKFQLDLTQAIFRVDINDPKGEFSSYFPSDSSEEQKRAIVDIAAITGLGGKRYLKEVRVILGEHKIRRGEIIPMIRASKALRQAVATRLISEHPTIRSVRKKKFF